MKRSWKAWLVSLCGIALAVASPASARLDSKKPADEARHYDARIEFNKGFVAERSLPAARAVQGMAREVPELAVSYDEATGAVRSLSNNVGYLTEARPGQDALALATEYARENLAALGLEESDFAGYEVTDSVFSKVTGATTSTSARPSAACPSTTRLHLST
jgi:hypothetical protein